MGVSVKPFLKSGERYNRLVVIGVNGDSIINNPTQPSKWKYTCKCDCGNITLINKSEILYGKVKSCGCLRKEIFSKTHENHRKVNITEDYGDFIKILFFNCDGYTIINKKDYNLVKDYCWRRVKAYNSETLYYAKANGLGRHNTRSIELHRLLLEFPDGLVDHKDGDGLNNSRDNLRVVTSSENSINRKIAKNNMSGITGVYWFSSINKWGVTIQVNNERINLGYYTNINDAIHIRKNAEVKYFGDNRRK